MKFLLVVSREHCLTQVFVNEDFPGKSPMISAVMLKSAHLLMYFSILSLLPLSEDGEIPT